MHALRTGHNSTGKVDDDEQNTFSNDLMRRFCLRLFSWRCGRLRDGSQRKITMPRPQKPADLKEATDSRHKVNPQAVTLEILKEPEVVPEWLNEPAKDHWKRIAPMLASQGIATELDRPILCTLCHALGVFHNSCDAQECRLLLKAISELSDKLNMNPKARAQSGFAQVKTGIDSRK